MMVVECPPNKKGNNGAMMTLVTVTHVTAISNLQDANKDNRELSYFCTKHKLQHPYPNSILAMKFFIFSSFAFLAAVEAGVPKPEILVSETAGC